MNGQTISLFGFIMILFTIGFTTYLTQDVFAASGISSAVANDPDDGDTVYSVGDTIVITFPAATNATASGTMNNAEIIANFTWSASDIDSDALTGSWDGTATVLTLLVNTIVGSTPPVIDTETVNFSPPAGATHSIGYFGNNTEFATNTVTLTGDFGLFVAVTTTSGGGSGCTDCTSPTLGVLDNGRRIVDDGFSYNGKSVDVENYFTPYPLVTVKVGKQNVAEFKIYENLGIDNIRHFELAFGLANGESIGMSKAVINWDKTFDGTETVTTYDPENVLDKVKVTTSEGYCSDTMQTKCLIVKVVHTFRAPLDFDILGTNVWDTKHNAWNNYFNHGIEVVGESLNPPKEYEATDKRQLYHLTETGNTSAVDEFGNSWSLEYGVWAKDFIQNKKIIDGTEQNGINRNNAWFNMYKQGQELVAKEELKQLCPSCSDKEFTETNDIFAYEFQKPSSALKNSELQNNMMIESEKAQKIMAYLLDPILHLKTLS